MPHGPDARSRDIGAAMTLALHLTLALGLMLGVEMETTAATPVQGRAVLQLRVHEASTPSPPPVVAPQPEPKPKPKPKPTPEPRPEPKPEPVPEPVPVPKPESTPVADPQPQVEAAPAETEAGPTNAAPPAPRIGDPENEKRVADQTSLVVAALRARIEAAKRYPFAARKAGITGTVRVLVEIDGYGRVAGYRLADPGQTHEKLRSGADKTMERLVGVRLSEVRLPSSLLVEVPIVYELR